MAQLPLIACTIREMGRTIAKFDAATLDEIEAAAAPTKPFSDEDRQRILEIAAEGRRVHLMQCGGSKYLTGDTIYIVCASATEARARGYRSITSV